MLFNRKCSTEDVWAPPFLSRERVENNQKKGEDKSSACKRRREKYVSYDHILKK